MSVCKEHVGLLLPGATSHPQITPHENDPQANCANTAVKDKCISWNICHTEASHHLSESICLLNYQPLHCIHGSVQYLFETVDTSRYSFLFSFFFFDVALSLKDECAPKKDYNRMPVLCVFLVSLKSSDGLLSVHVWAQVDLFIYLFIF